VELGPLGFDVLHRSCAQNATRRIRIGVS
jgi:hypothetical protein